MKDDWAFYLTDFCSGLKIWFLLACCVYMIKAKVAFLEGRLFSSQSGLLNTLQIALIGWIKAGPLKKATLFWSCKQAIYAILACLHVACLHDQNKSVLEGRLCSSQSELLENFSNCSEWLDKSRPSKKATFVLIMSQSEQFKKLSKSAIGLKKSRSSKKHWFDSQLGWY